jgi:predicted alternative tryptophan synthase beta-subunit
MSTMPHYVSFIFTQYLQEDTHSQAFEKMRKLLCSFLASKYEKNIDIRIAQNGAEGYMGWRTSDWLEPLIPNRRYHPALHAYVKVYFYFSEQTLTIGRHKEDADITQAVAGAFEAWLKEQGIPYTRS